ncbi:MAG: cob(I)yrinic acid a,c-diamide adenosyltransferase [Candidatus Micrarchaeota archaeon]|nr:cob(I)yrinic acid a,c-diamide adenosyltransferase [Candidatus Micrarchaeota archaeon]
MGLIHLYTGNGGGKTAAALGICLRALGHGLRCVVIQFMKARITGEALVKLPGLEFYRFGREEFVDPEHPEEIDIELAHAALEKAKEVLKTGPDVLVLDEIAVACAFGLLKVEEVREVLSDIPERTTVYLTGRYAPKELEDLCDFVTVLEDKKRPEKNVFRRGIEW